MQYYVSINDIPHPPNNLNAVSDLEAIPSSSLDIFSPGTLNREGFMASTQFNVRDSVAPKLVRDP